MFRPNAEETEFTIVGRLENVLGKKGNMPLVY